MLIEAYEALKTGVPIMEVSPGGARIYRRATNPNTTQTRPSDYEAIRRAAEFGARGQSASSQGRYATANDPGQTAAYRAGQELFRSVMGGTAEPAGIAAVLRRSAVQTRPADVPGIEFFKRAESQLEQTIRRFEGQKTRSRKYWARDYISGIVKVQILYRDIVSRYPMLASRARERLQNLEQLVLELRPMAR